MNRLRPDKIADERQMADRIEDLIRLVYEARDYWPQVQRQAKEMGGGFPSSSIAGYGGGSDGSVVENAFDDNGNLKWDPAVAARDALTEFDAAYHQLKSVVKRMHHLTTPAPDKRAEPSDNCARCDRTISGTAGTDPNLSGFCVECFGAWVELGRPERGDFVKMHTCAECGEVAMKSEQPEWFADHFVHHRSIKPSCYQAAYRRVKKGA